MATRVQFKAGVFEAATFNSTSTSAALSFDSSVTIGNLVLIAIPTENNTRTMDSAASTGGSFTVGPEGTLMGSAGSMTFMYRVATTANCGQNVVVTASGNVGDRAQVLMWEISLATTTGVVSAESAGESTTTHGSGSVTPANATGFLVAAGVRTNGDYTDDSNFTEETTGVDNVYAGYIANNAASSRALAYTSADPEFSVTQIIAFAGAAVAGGTNNLLLMGVG